MVAHLKRNVGNNTRFYSIRILPTLFNEFMIEVLYGNISYKKPSGSKIYHFTDQKKAIKYFESIINQKVKKGYR